MKKAEKNDFMLKAKGYYLQLRKKLSDKYPPESYICIEPISGDYFIGKSAIDVMRQSEKKHPDKRFFVAQLGRMTGLLK